MDDLFFQPIAVPGGNFDCEPLLEKLRGCETLLDAAAYCLRFNSRCMMRFTGNPVERENVYICSEGGLLQIGGGYLPNYNMFSLGAAALNGAFFDGTSGETMFGTFGMQMAHEISHSFDRRNIRTDASGNSGIITEEEYKTFLEITQPIADKLNRINTGRGHCLDGELNCSETIADLQGIRLLLDVAAQEEGFDYDSFFRAVAGLYFCYEKGIDYYPPDDPHPPYYVRANFPLAHFDEFYLTYPSVTKGTPMYIAPEDRILAW